MKAKPLLKMLDSVKEEVGKQITRWFAELPKSWQLGAVLLLLLLFVVHLYNVMEIRQHTIDSLKETVDSKNERVRDLEAKVKSLANDLEAQVEKSGECTRRCKELELKIRELESTRSDTEVRDSILGYGRFWRSQVPFGDRPPAGMNEAR